MRKILIFIGLLLTITLSGQLPGVLTSQNVVTDSYGEELIINGIFDHDDHWTMDANWSITTGVLRGATWGNKYVYPMVQPLALSTTYHVVFTISNRTEGSVIIYFNNILTIQTTERNSDGTYTEDITTNGINCFMSIKGVDFFGDIDNLSIKEVL